MRLSPPLFRRTATIVAATTAVLVLGAGTALAHVSVSPTTAAPGGYATLSFRVPNESATATTTKVEIQLPAATPFPSVSAKQTPGWIIDPVTTTLPAPVTQGTVTLDKAVTSVTFTADGAGLAPHEFVTFDLLVGPVPDVGSISFVALQTYNDGEVVSWSEPTPAGDEEPEHPAPVLTISGAEVTGDDDAPANATTPAAAPATGTTDVPARVLGVAGVVVGLLGAGIAFGRRSVRRPTPTTPNTPARGDNDR